MADYTCSLVFLMQDDRILLAMKKRGFGSDRYNGIGGKQDPGESIEQTAVRECQEEVGITPLELDKVAYHDFIINADSAAPHHMFVHTYLCHDWQGEPVETEEMRPQWFKLSDIPYDRMWDDDILWLPAVLAGKRLETVFEFGGDERVMTAQVKVITASP